MNATEALEYHMGRVEGRDLRVNGHYQSHCSSTTFHYSLCESLELLLGLENVPRASADRVILGMVSSR